MSHFTTIKTQIVEIEFLRKALNDLKYNFNEGDIQISGYQGIRTNVNLKLSNHEIGFVLKEGVYECIADWWCIKDIKSEKFMEAVNHKYAYNLVKSKLEEQDFTFVTEEVTENATVHLTLRRMI